MNKLDQSLNELHKFGRTSEERLVVLEALEAKRKQDEFVKYWEPTTRQREILPKFTEGVKIFGVLGGNRSGKTELGAAVVVAWALGKEYFRGEPVWEVVKDLPIPNPPNNVWIVGLDFPMIRDVIWREKLRKGKEHPGFFPSTSSGVVEKVNDGDYQAFFKNGSVLTCKSAEAGEKKFQSASVDLVWIDEEPEKAVFLECYQRTIDCKGKILITLTPLTDIASGVRDPWVYELYEQYRSGTSDVCFEQLSVLDNPYVPESEKKRLLKQWEGSPEFGARIYGDFVQRTGLVYYMWDAKRHMVRPGPRDPSHLTVGVIDPAPTGVTAGLVADADQAGNLVGWWEYYESNKTVREHARDIKIRLSGNPVDVWLIDPKGGNQRNAEDHKTIAQLYREQGIPVALANVGSDYGIEASKAYLLATLDDTGRGGKVRLWDTLTKFKWEIEHYVWDSFKAGPMKGLTKEAPLKRHDHLMNCYQYLAAGRFRSRKGSSRSEDELREESRYSSYT